MRVVEWAGQWIVRRLFIHTVASFVELHFWLSPAEPSEDWGREASSSSSLGVGSVVEPCCWHEHTKSNQQKNWTKTEEPRHEHASGIENMWKHWQIASSSFSCLFNNRFFTLKLMTYKIGTRLLPIACWFYSILTIWLKKINQQQRRTQSWEEGKEISFTFYLRSWDVLFAQARQLFSSSSSFGRKLRPSLLRHLFFKESRQKNSSYCYFWPSTRN